jgi:hypothetical protein
MPSAAAFDDSPAFFRVVTDVDFVGVLELFFKTLLLILFAS